MTKTQKRLHRRLPLLKELCEKGLRAKAIKEHPKFKQFHIRTLQKRIVRLGFIDEVRSSRRKNSVRFTAEQHTGFMSFLDRNWQKYSIKDLVRLWKQNMAPKGYPVPSWATFRYWLLKLDRKHSRAEVFQLEYTQKRMKRVMRAICDKNAERAVGARGERRKNALKLNIELLKGKKTVLHSPCRKCKTEWAHDPRFWDKLRGELLLLECRFCRHEHRMVMARSTPEQKITIRKAQQLVMWLSRYESICTLESDAERLGQKAKEKKHCAGHCGNSWPLHDQYFQSQKRTTDSKVVKIDYRSRCRFCEDRLRLFKEAERKNLDLPPAVASLKRKSEAAK